MRYYVGQPFREELTVRDTTGALVDPTTVTLTFRHPDGSIQAGPAAVQDSTGQYHADVTLSVAGSYRRVWTTTGPGAGVSVADIQMVDPFAPEIVSLDDVKRHLNIDLDNAIHDEELTDLIASLPRTVEQYAGPVLPVERTEYHPGGTVLVVRRPPIAEITSITGVGGLVDLDTLDVDLPAGVIRYTTGIHPGPVTIVYVSGYLEVPEGIQAGAKIIVEHWWKSQRAAAASDRRRASGDDDTVNVPGMGFAVPRYAAQLLMPFNPDTGLR